VKSVRRKLNPIPLEFKDRVVLLVDDSIVRGTTSRADHPDGSRGRCAQGLFGVSRAAGALSQRVWHRHAFCGRTGRAWSQRSEVQQQLGCDWLIYQDLADLEAAVGGPKQRLTQFDSSCFTGEYVTGIQPGYFERIRQLRSDSKAPPPPELTP
jgi:amidophosphoribosyltransferase